jgi:hypothetical protein
MSVAAIRHSCQFGSAWRMSDSLHDTLSRCVDDPPSDLVAHFISPSPGDDKLRINLLRLDDAIKYSVAIQKSTLLGKPMGLFALDDANDSNPHCYITRGPARGCILHLRHDGEPTIRFRSLTDFLGVTKTAIAERTDVDDLPAIPPTSAVDQNALCERTNQLFSTNTDEATAELVVLLQLLDTGRVETVAALARHSDFFVREAVATLISTKPHVELRSVAEELSKDKHPQVARPGKAALSAVKRLQFSKR